MNHVQSDDELDGQVAMKKGYLYMVSNFRRTTLYTGVTSDLPDRIQQHKHGKGSKFTGKYKLKYLMYYEEHDSIYEAILREKQIKNWHSKWKWNLVRSVNPDLRDLSDELW